MPPSTVTCEEVGYDDLPAWGADDHLSAFEAFLKSGRPVADNAAKTERGGAKAVPAGLLKAIVAAQALAATPVDGATARSFFETRFRPHRVAHDCNPGLLTGYYEPLIEGARERTARFTVPVLKRPADLVNMFAESQRGAVGQALTHAHQTATGVEPFETRAEIEAGALDGQHLEFIWLEDPVDAFFLHIQGSGQIRLPDGETIRITYDGKNGHPYTSVGRYLIDRGLFPEAEMSLDGLKVWLSADRERGRAAMHQNASYVFFRELKGSQAASAMGVLEIPLTPGRSLAVDAGFHAIGLPVYVAAPLITHAGDREGFHRLMVAQDVGSAIRGPERGDLYFGSGDEAGRLAGITKHPGRFFVLLPRAGS